MASKTLVIVDSGGGLSPVRRQKFITWTNADLLSIGPPGTIVSWNLKQNTITVIIKQHAFGNAVFQMVAILIRPWWFQPLVSLAMHLVFLIVRCPFTSHFTVLLGDCNRFACLPTIRLQLIAHQLSFVHNSFHSPRIGLIFCTEHDTHFRFLWKQWILWVNAICDTSVYECGPFY